MNFEPYMIQLEIDREIGWYYETVDCFLVIVFWSFISKSNELKYYL